MQILNVLKPPSYSKKKCIITQIGLAKPYNIYCEMSKETGGGELNISCMTEQKYTIKCH